MKLEFLYATNLSYLTYIGIFFKNDDPFVTVTILCRFMFLKVINAQFAMNFLIALTMINAREVFISS